MKRTLLPLIATLALSLPVAAAPQIDITGTNGTTPVSATNPLPVSTSLRTTYNASTAYFTPAATATDMFYIAGSASKTIRVLRVTVEGTQTTAGVNNFFLIKRSAANSGGTAVATTKVPLDSTASAATATVQHYTANPTPGAAVGTVKVISALTPAPASSSAGGEIVVFDELFNGSGIVLRGTAEGLALNFNGAAIPAGMSLAVNVSFTEE